MYSTGGLLADLLSLIGSRSPSDSGQLLHEVTMSDLIRSCSFVPSDGLIIS